MGELVKLSDYAKPWREVFVADAAASTFRVYANALTGELEFVQTNDDGETIRTVLSWNDVLLFVEAIMAVLERRSRGESR